jgi:hypothetical protein
MSTLSRQSIRPSGRIAPESCCNFIKEGRNTLAGNGRNGKDPEPFFGKIGSYCNEIFPHMGKIDLVYHDDLRLFRKFFVKELEFPVQGLVVMDRITVRHEGEIKNVKKQAISLNVLEKAVAEPGTLMGALNKTRDVRNHKGTEVFIIDDPEVRGQGGKRIVGDLRASRGYPGNKGRLADAGKTEESNISQKLQFEPEGPLLSRLSGLSKFGSLVGGGGKTCVSVIQRSSPFAPCRSFPMPWEPRFAFW